MHNTSNDIEFIFFVVTMYQMFRKNNFQVQYLLRVKDCVKVVTLSQFNMAEIIEIRV